MPPILLPQELIDKILGLIPSKSTLRTCSLVSHSWLPASRVLLHGSLTISKSDIRRLVGLLRSPENTFTPIVRTLELDTDPDDPALNEQLPPLFARLYTFTYLERLVLCGVQLYTDFKIPLVPSVVSIELIAVLVHSLPILTSFVSYFPNLRKLKIASSSIGAGTSFQTEALHPRLELDTLAIDVSTIGAAFAWLGSSATAPIARTLDISAKSPPTYAINQRISAYLRWLGPRLIHLCITLPSFTGSLDFSVNSSLESLIVHDALSIALEPLPSPTSLPWVVDIAPTTLSFLSLFDNTSTLTTLTFSITGNLFIRRTVISPHMDDFGRKLSALQLKTVRLQLSDDFGTGGRNAVRTSFVSRLPPAVAGSVVIVGGSGM
ncbi:hypothetical protein R3P38DRAFT_3305234 [Favolaschia claudopus]|uniref:F-box domain-containing protein n=1 Tax=Favolaschia claudopus TaxID=2862362 RepID=A0AAW0DTB0_9AGAR